MMIHNAASIDLQEARRVEARAAAEAARAFVAECRGEISDFAARLFTCPATIEAHERFFLEQEAAYGREWEAEKILLVAENAEFCAERRLRAAEEARVAAEAAAAQRRRDAVLITERERLLRLREDALEAVRTGYAAPARGIRSLIRTEIAIGSRVKRGSGERPWPAPRLDPSTVLTHPRVLSLLSLPNLEDGDFTPYWHPHYSRLEDVDRRGLFAEIRADILDPFRDAGHDLEGAIAVASAAIRRDYLRLCAEIVELLRLWSKAWIEIDRFNAAAEDRRRLGLGAIETLNKCFRRDGTSVSALPRSVYLPDLSPDEPPLWDWSSDLTRFAEDCL
jgi:hypothetical protein